MRLIYWKVFPVVHECITVVHIDIALLSIRWQQSKCYHFDNNNEKHLEFYVNNTIRYDIVIMFLIKVNAIKHDSPNDFTQVWLTCLRWI